MPDIVSLQYTFGNLSGNIPLSYLDADITAIANGLNGIGNGTATIGTVIIGQANVASAAISNLSIQNLLPVSYGGTGSNISVITDGQLLIGSNTTGGLSLASITATGGAKAVSAPGSITLSRPSNLSSKFRVITLTAPGTTTFTANAATTHKFTIVGGGGAGGGTINTNHRVSGGGGGGGGAGVHLVYLPAGANVTITVGKGGNTVISGAGEPGGNSSIIFSNNLSIVCTGGAGGDAARGNITVNGGAAGIGINATISIAGSPGMAAMTANTFSAQICFSGSGGSSFLGIGASQVVLFANTAGGITQTSGLSGFPFGSGGSGGARTDAATNNGGGNGASGIVIIEWLYS